MKNLLKLTFDDGPHPTLTPKLLNILKKRNVKATFFVQGNKVKKYPDITRRAVDEGHEIGNHTWSHFPINQIDLSILKNELILTTDVIREASGRVPIIMRPPYGATNANLNKLINDEFHMNVVMWSLDSKDWKYKDSILVLKRIINNSKSGDIILTHDIYASTILAIPPTLDRLLEKGFNFATVSEF